MIFRRCRAFMRKSSTYTQTNSQRSLFLCFTIQIRTLFGSLFDEWQMRSSYFICDTFVQFEALIQIHIYVNTVNTVYSIYIFELIMICCKILQISKSRAYKSRKTIRTRSCVKFGTAFKMYTTLIFDNIVTKL